MPRPLVRAAVFDAYGTLFDVHSAVGPYQRQLGEAAVAISQLWRTKQLEYTWLRSLMQRHVDFWQVTGEALDYALETHGVDQPALRDQLLDAYNHLSCYPEVPATLQQLRDQGIHTAILSNGAPPMLEAGVQSAGLTPLLDAVLSVEAVGVYKPDPRVYALATQHFSCQPEEILFFSSNSWDVAGAATFGFEVAWINRFSQRPERLPDGPRYVLRSLDEIFPQLEASWS